jgi:hypothetical protein
VEVDKVPDFVVIETIPLLHYKKVELVDVDVAFQLEELLVVIVVPSQHKEAHLCRSC